MCQKTLKQIFEKNGILLGFSLVAVKHFDNDERLPNMKVLSTIDLVCDFEKPFTVQTLGHQRN